MDIRESADWTSEKKRRALKMCFDLGPLLELAVYLDVFHVFLHIFGVLNLPILV